MSKCNDLFERRQRRTRFKVLSRASGRPRLSVFRSKRHMYVQVIDDKTRCTLASASTLDKDVTVKSTSGKEAAEAVGKLIAIRAVKAGVESVVFDRGGYLYHGRVKALADAARSAGLSF